MHPIPLVIGLTGGIASGKSTVAQQFAALGVPVIDTDVIARELVAPEHPALSAIAAHFGTQVLRPDGQLNRPWLRQRIFSDASARNALNAIMHPRIRAQVGFELDALRQKPTAYVIVVVPLLVESQTYDDLLQRVAVVDLPEEEQLRRLKARDNIDTTQAQAILDSQASRSQRLQRADDVIDNSGTTTELASQVETLHEHYSRLAAQSKER